MLFIFRFGYKTAATRALTVKVIFFRKKKEEVEPKWKDHNIIRILPLNDLFKEKEF